MNLITLLAVLAGSNWSTTCVMTQADLEQGYTIDTVQFQKAPTAAESTLAVTITRTWFKDDQCSTASGKSSTVAGNVKIGKAISSGSIFNQSSELIEADWTLNNSTCTELGAISYDKTSSSIQLATTSYGNTRNTMVSLFKYFSK